MNAQRPKLQLHRFERVDASATNALLRVTGVWCAEPQLRLEPLALLVDDGERSHRIAQLADPGSERAQLAARDAEQWRGTFPVLMALLGEPDISFAIDTGHGFVMLPFPVQVERPGGPALSGAPRQPTAPDEIRLLWQSARRLEQQVESLGQESSRTRSVATDACTRAARTARDRAERVHELEGECDGLHASIAQLAAAHDDERSRLQRERSKLGERLDQAVANNAQLAARLDEEARARAELEERLRLDASRDEARRARLADDLALAQDEQRSLSEELDRARAERDAARAQLDPLCVERAGAFSELVTTNAERKRHQAELLRVLDERARDAQRLDEIAAERDEACKDLSGLRDELSARMLEIERERNAAARMQRRIDELEIAEVRAAEAEGEARGARSVQEGASAP